MSQIDLPSNYLITADSLLLGASHQWYVIALKDLASNLKVHSRHDISANCGYLDGSVRTLNFDELLSDLNNVHIGN